MSFVRRWIFGLECPVLSRIDGKTVIITGANCGIGKETACELALRGGNVIMACRDLKRSEEAAAEIRKRLSDETGHPVGTIVVKQLDLASLQSVRQFAKNITETESRLDILINNAGIMMCPYWKTEDGFEMQFGVNHLGHFLLTNLLLDLLKKSAPSRIVTVSSVAHSFGVMKFDDINSEKVYYPGEAYSQSKLANVLFSVELAERLKGTGVCVYALHPGAVYTDLWRYSNQAIPRIVPWLVTTFGTFFMRNAVEGAQTTIYCAVADDLKNQSGLYYADCTAKTPSGKADKESATRLWELSCRLTGIEE